MEQFQDETTVFQNFITLLSKINVYKINVNFRKGAYFWRKITRIFKNYT